MRTWLDRLRRRPVLVAVLLLGGLAFAALEWVRGSPVVASGMDLPGLIREVATGERHILSQQDLDRIGSLAHALVTAEGKKPGRFYLHFLPYLDYLEKFRHLIHAPFVGAYTNLYCDVWIHSLTTYGSRELTWTLVRTEVRPALELPILLFLLDRLGMERSVFQERVGAIFEATRGMGMHQLDGRSALWDRLLRHAVKYPELADFIQEQLRSYDWNAVEGAEIRFWREIALDPTRKRVTSLIAGTPPRAPGKTPHPMQGVVKFRELLATYSTMR